MNEFTIFGRKLEEKGSGTKGRKQTSCEGLFTSSWCEHSKKHGKKHGKFVASLVIVVFPVFFQVSRKPDPGTAALQSCALKWTRPAP